MEAKQAHRQFPQEAQNRSQITGEQFMMDIWGPARVTSIGGLKYYISFCNDSVRYFITIFLWNKGEVAQQIKDHVAKIKQKFRKAPTFMRADNRKELINDPINTSILYFNTPPWPHKTFLVFQHDYSDPISKVLMNASRKTLCK